MIWHAATNATGRSQVNRATSLPAIAPLIARAHARVVVTNTNVPQNSLGCIHANCPIGGGAASWRVGASDQSVRQQFKKKGSLIAHIKHRVFGGAARKRLFGPCKLYRGRRIQLYTQSQGCWSVGQITPLKRVCVSAVYRPNSTYEHVAYHLAKHTRHHDIIINCRPLYRQLPSFGDDMRRAVGGSSDKRQARKTGG